MKRSRESCLNPYFTLRFGFLGLDPIGWHIEVDDLHFDPSQYVLAYLMHISTYTNVCAQAPSSELSPDIDLVSSVPIGGQFSGLFLAFSLNRVYGQHMH